MTQLEKLARKFKKSRPVLKITVSNRDIDVDDRDPVYKYDYPVDTADALSVLISNFTSEHFVVKSLEFEVDHENIASRAMDTIRTKMRIFVEKNLDMKAPRQNKLYRWVRYMPQDRELNDGLEMLYKYMWQFCSIEMLAAAGNVEHVNNSIAILTAMMEKYEK